VLLVSYLQAYVEAVFHEAAAHAYRDLSESELNEIVKSATEQFHNPTPAQIARLFLTVGVPRLTHKFHWNRWPSQRVRAELKRLVDARHKIAHDARTKTSWRHFSVTKAELLRWYQLVVRFRQCLENKFGERDQDATG
jgi:hypothetical protein